MGVDLDNSAVLRILKNVKRNENIPLRSDKPMSSVGNAGPCPSNCDFSFKPLNEKFYSRFVFI